jgi:NAD(P)-dependent dehydrogenase (short-subunit alcohol dehydrogenase family)
MSDMNGKVALITGANSGIGRATAEAFAKRGVKVVLAARREVELRAVAAEINAQGGEASFLVTDVAVASQAERMVAHTVDTFGQLDYAVNNAAVEPSLRPIVDLTEQEWDRVLDVNLKGNFLCLKYQAKVMLASGRGGAIVNVGSVNSFRGVPGGADYVASKHGQVGLTSCASAELAPFGIRVNIVCPGVIDTPMHRRLREIVGDDVFDKQFVPRVHSRRIGRPAEIAGTIVFLCSDEASYITGTTLTPDGGYTSTM